MQPMQNSRIAARFVSLALLGFLFSCSKSELYTVPDVPASLDGGLDNGSSGVGDGSGNENVIGENPDLPDENTATPAPPAPAPPAPVEKVKMEALSWESSTRPQAVNWSKYAFEVIREEAFVDLNKAKDAELFCPKYDRLTEDQKVNFWGALFSGMAKFESGYDPTTRYHESTMGTDPVTKQPVYSEGLLQLSYQDTQWAPYCEFDWNKDKYLKAKDPKKTILDPYKNLRCGILIMARQIRNKGNIVLSSGVYWAVLKKGGRYQKINEIIAITKKLSFCK